MVAIKSALLVLASGLLAQAAPVEDHTTLQKRIWLGVPTGWREFSNKFSKSQRNNIAVNAMKKMLTVGGSDAFLGSMSYWQAGNVWSALILKDLYAGTTDFKKRTLTALTGTFKSYPNFRQNVYNDDTLWWGTAAIYAYEAYNDKQALTWAEETWTNVQQYQIKGTSGQGKNYKWEGTCNNHSMNGGVWWNTRPADDNVNTITTGLFMTLSARLYAETKNEKYLQGAEKALTWIQSHLLNTTTQMVYDTVSAKDCHVTNWVFTYNLGKYVEGLAVLGAATGKSEYTNAAIAAATAGMKTAPWQKADGIITETSNNPHNKNNDGWGFKAVWIRALAELFRRNPKNGGLRTLIHSYIDVQANALIELDSNTKNDKADEFGGNWHGPFDKMYPWTQLAALDPLAAFVLAN